jgi:hypothetical protein
MTSRAEGQGLEAEDATRANLLKNRDIYISPRFMVLGPLLLMGRQK